MHPKKNRTSGIALALIALVAASVGACSRIQTGGIGGNPWTHPGVLRWGLDQEPDSLNPMLSSLQVSVDVSMLWAGYLFNYDDRNQLLPELATKVPTPANGGISRDGLSITYHLRSGVRWQDGQPFTADDVIFSWRQVVNPNNNVPGRLGYDDVSSIDRIDSHTIVVHLFRPYSPFVATFFTMAALAYPVLPKHLLDGHADINRLPYNSMPIGTGPFRIVWHEHGEGIRLEANPLYWRGAPKLREIDVTFVPDQNTLVSQLRTREVDLVTNLSVTRAPDVQDLTGDRIYAVPFTYFVLLGFDTASPPCDDARVRHALAMALDKSALVKRVTHGYSLYADSDQPPFAWAHASGLPAVAFDPVKAGELLDAAGWQMGSDGFRHRGGKRLDVVLVSTAGNVTYKTAEQIMQSQWTAIGVNTIIKNLPDAVLYAPLPDGGILASGKFDAYINGWFNGVDPDDSPMFDCDQRPPGGDNYTRTCDPVIEAAERTALRSYSQSTRAAAYATIQREIARQAPAMFLWFAKRIDVANSDLQNYRPAHAVTTFWNSWQWSI